MGRAQFEINERRSHKSTGRKLGRTAIKIVENGVPTYANASADQLREIPNSTVSASKQASIIRDTYKYVQGQMDLSDYNLQKSLQEIEQSNTLEQ